MSLHWVAALSFYLGVVTYSVSATLFFMDLVRREGRSSATGAATLLGAAAGWHLVYLVTASLFTHVCPVESLHFGLGVSAIMAAAAYLLLRRRMRIDAVGVAVAPLGLTLLVGAEFVGSGAVPANTPRALLAVHVAANVLGVGLFLLAGAAGAFYLLQERRLRSKRFSGVGKLPALDMLDLAEHRLLLAGFPLLTFGIVSGAIFASRVDVASATGVRAALAYATWALVAGVLVMRALAGWRGRRAAYGTLAGVVCVLLVIALYVVRAMGVA